MDLSTATSSSSIGLGIMLSPTSPVQDTRRRASQSHASAPSQSGTSTACSSRDFMSFTSHFATSICRRMPLRRISSNIPSDMVVYTHHILNTTQVSLSIVVLALRILKQVQEKLDLLLLQSGNPAKRSDSDVFGASMKDVELQVLDRLSRRVTVKSLFVVSLMLAMKSPNGCCNTFTNPTWSQVASVPVSILSSIELDVTLLLGFNLWVDEQQYVMWLNTVRIAAEEFSFKTAQFQHHQQQLQLHASQQQQQQRYAKLLVQQQRVRKQIQTKDNVQGHRLSGMPSPSSPSAPNAGFSFEQRRKSFTKGARLAPYASGEDVMSVQRMQRLMQAMPSGSFAEKVVGMMVPK
ncbi:hypothetical protein BJ741DRAFT_588189 [Chytriomyces cf. hyalinus JEL632]|nr:hypothetical protein BJ741DRAFT_588189 [Chytriomyces cf. hyalinus JEL632]